MTAPQTLTINKEHAEVHLAILGQRDKYLLTVKNHTTNDAYNEEVSREKLVDYAEKMNNQGYCVWVSLNPKEKDGNLGVTALADFWLDIDRPKETKDKTKVATEKELEETLQRANKLKEYIEKKYNAIGLMAYSGNGFHLHFPLPITQLTHEQRKPLSSKETETNNLANIQVRNFAKNVAAIIGKEIDSTYDINRKTTLIGTHNLKLPQTPLLTKWDKLIVYDGLEKALAYVQTAREQNQALIEAILKTPIDTETSQPSTITTKSHPKLEAILNNDFKLRDFYNGDFKKHTGKDDRSEAEMTVISKLMWEGFSDEEVTAAMENCKIGKWEKTEQYREHTLRRAREFYNQKQAENETKANEEALNKFYELLLVYPNVKTAFDGNYKKHYKTPKEADLEVLKILFKNGKFTMGEMRFVMTHSKAGYWNNEETTEEKRNELLVKAERQVKAEKEQNIEEKQQVSQADRLVILCLSEDIELFFDQHKTPYARVKMPCGPCDTCGICAFFETFTAATSNFQSVNMNTKEEKKHIVEGSKVAETPQTSQIPQYRYNIVPLSSSFFKDWLAHLMWENEEKTPGNDSLRSAINVLRGKAILKGKQYFLYNRVAPDDNGLWLDLADKRNRAIKVTAKGWEIVNNPPILFKRYNHQLPIPAPSREGDAWKLLDFTNLDSTDNNTRLAALCSVISYLLPLISHPAIIVSGPQGSAKSWFLKLIKQLIDPSSIELLSLPKDERELAQQLDHHWIAPYDNLSSLPKWASDTLCKGVTGGGIAVRKLYTDDEDTILTFKRCVMLNGINVAAQKGDLLDRAILISFSTIEQEKRKTEAQLNQEFEKEKPKLLAGFLQVISKALELYPTINCNLQRLADFSKYGCAIALALGKNQTEFEQAYAIKVEQQNEEALNADPVALSIIKFCSQEVKGQKLGTLDKQLTDCWEGQPSELYAKLIVTAQQLGIDVKAKEWPRSPNALTRRINMVAPALKAFGCSITSYQGTPRKIRIDASNLKTEKPALEESNVCFFCGKGIMDNDWVQDDFSGNKPAHKRCYDGKREQLVRQDEREAS